VNSDSSKYIGAGCTRKYLGCPKSKKLLRDFPGDLSENLDIRVHYDDKAGMEP
jgi:hypothetical protein